MPKVNPNGDQVMMLEQMKRVGRCDGLATVLSLAVVLGQACVPESASQGPSPEQTSADAGTWDIGGGPPQSDNQSPPNNSVADAGTSLSSDSGSPSYGPAPIEDDQTDEQYGEYQENEFVETAEDNLATFSIDVDTASYTIMRRDLNHNRLPVEQGVRVEEYINFFDYDYPAPEPDDDTPLSVHVEAAPSYFGDDLQLLRIAIQGMEIPEEDRDPANLVFLIDVSGSMQDSDKLPLVQYALSELVNGLRKQDTIGIVVYAGYEAVLLEPTPIQRRAEILDAIAGLAAGGSTAGEAGLRRAYQLAQSAFIEDGINRVVLCTDGDFNVGETDHEALLDLLEEYRDRGITLTTLGFGIGNLNDEMLEQLADHSNGNYAYIDSRNEALRVLGENLVGTLQVIAKDVKIQVVLNPETVVRYRLVGYDNRVLEDWEFTDDTVDAGEIGSSHSVTAFLELELAEDVQPGSDVAELVEVLIRYKQPDADVSTEISHSFGVDEMHADFDAASDAFRFTAAVTEFAEILRRGLYSEGARFDEVLEIADGAFDDDDPTRIELLELIETAASLWSD